jgi:hypothetical protein
MELSAYVATILGTAIGIIAMYQNASGTRQRIMAIVGAAFISMSAIYMFYVIERLASLESTARQAEKLISEHGSNHISEGFILAAMTFLEAHRDEFPDTYERALEICARYKCTSPDQEIQDGYKSNEAAYMFKSILKGVRALKSE